MHLTTKSSRSVEALTRRFRDGFIRRAAVQARKPVPHFCCIERREHGHHHVHALTSGTELLLVAELEAMWGWGFARVQVYDPHRRAAYYVSKELHEGNDDFFVSRRWPPLQRTPAIRSAPR